MKTKQIILFALFSLISMGVLWAQEQMPYKSKATFKTDTLQYLEYNFTERAPQYVGKKVSDVLKDLELPVLYIAECAVISDIQQRTTKVRSLAFAVNNVEEHPNVLNDYYIVMYFTDPPSFADYKEASGFNNDNINPKFTDKLYDFIKDMKVSHVTSNPYIIQKRENLKKANTINEIGKDKKD